MLQEQRIGTDGVYTYDKVAVAIERLRAFEALALEYSPEGYYLCDSGGKDRVCVTGVRWGESTNRAKSRGVAEVLTPQKADKLILLNDNDESRKEFETCQIKGKRVVNPIIDWTDDDVWEFIKLRGIVVNPLYAMGHKRVGCIGCPMNSRNGEELDAMPKYKANWIRWFGHLIEDAKRDGRPCRFKTAEEYYAWWTLQKALVSEEQMRFEDEED